MVSRGSMRCLKKKTPWTFKSPDQFHPEKKQKREKFYSENSPQIQAADRSTSWSVLPCAFNGSRWAFSNKIAYKKRGRLSHFSKSSQNPNKFPKKKLIFFSFFQCEKNQKFHFTCGDKKNVHNNDLPSKFFGRRKTEYPGRMFFFRLFRLVCLIDWLIDWFVYWSAIIQKKKKRKKERTICWTVKWRTEETRTATSSSWAAICSPWWVPSIFVKSTKTLTYLQAETKF